MIPFVYPTLGTGHFELVSHNHALGGGPRQTVMQWCCLCFCRCEQVDNQLLVTPYPALLYPISEALPPRHPAVRLCEGQGLLPSLTPGGSARNDPERDGDRKVLSLHRWVKWLGNIRRDVHCYQFVLLGNVNSLLECRLLDKTWYLEKALEMSVCRFPRCTPSSPTHLITSHRYHAAAVQRKACFELILRRDLGYAWVNFVRLISVRVVPMDINLDMALVDAFLELSTRMTELMDVSSLSVL